MPTPLPRVHCRHCRYHSGQHADWCPDRGPVEDAEKGKFCPYPLAPNSLCWVEQGKYQGCLLDLIRREGQYYIMRRSSYPEEVATKRVTFYRT